MTTARKIIEEVAEEWGITPNQLISGSRAYCQPRFKAMHRMRTETKLGSKSLTWIGSQLGGKHHTAVMNGLRKFEEQST